jgi:poly-gamma-glutamate synthesis protein (capsule biosynthesis protein)
MTHRHLAVYICLAVAAAGAVVFFVPRGTTIRYVADATPIPIPSPTPPEPVTLLFGGDVMLSRSVGDAMARANDWGMPFRNIASVTAAADVMFVNLESVISEKGAVAGCGYCFRADPRTLEGLQVAGIDVVSVANNHAWDFGPAAFADSLVRLASSGIGVTGGGTTVFGAREPLVQTVRGTRIAYLAYTDMLPAGACATENRVGVNCYDAVRMPEDIARARSMADVVVVSFHTGDEYVGHNAKQTRIYRAAIDAGADIVAGHHPHVVQDVERYQPQEHPGRVGWIAYSLGNFVFDQMWSEPTMHGQMLRVVVRDDAVSEVQQIPVVISRGYQVSVGK